MPATKFRAGTRGTKISVDSNNAVITLAETNQLTTTSGKLGHVIVWGVGVGAEIIIYDNASASSGQIWDWVTATGIGTYVLQLPVQNGIRVVTTGGTPASCDVVYD